MQLPIRTKKVKKNALVRNSMSWLLWRVTVEEIAYTNSCLEFGDSHSNLNGIVGLVYRLNMTSFLTDRSTSSPFSLTFSDNPSIKSITSPPFCKSYSEI